jgi:hypothetical protein
MQSFQNHIDEASALKFYNLLPKKVRHAINRFAHQDKYKAALAMYHELKKNKDVKQRNLPDNKLKSIAADFFKLNHGEFEKILNRKTRYETVENWEINEANLKIGDLKKDLWRWQAFVKKIKTGDPFVTTDGKKIILDKSILKGVKDVSDMAGVALTSGGKKVTWKQIEKTHEFGGGGSSGEPSGAQWEALICVGVNKIKGKFSSKSSEWKSIQHFWGQYGKASKLLGQAFINEYKVKELKQLGGATRSTNPDWLGKDKTPKTDMLDGKIHISLKKKGGSQLMSGSPAESLSTFNAALTTYSISNTKEIYALMDNIENDMGKMSTVDSINSIKALRDSGKRLSKADAAKVAQMDSLHNAADELNKQLNQVFATPNFKSHFCWEAATGATKFKPSPDAIANYVAVFNPQGKIHESLKLDSINKAGMYLAKNNNFYISFKGGGRPYLVLRSKKAKITETFADIVREECSTFLTEDIEHLNEFQLFDKLKRSVKNVSTQIVNQAKKILDAILLRIKQAFVDLKKLGEKVLQGLLKFFGLEVKNIKIKGGGPFPLV